MAAGAHFLPPIATTTSSDFIGAISINGLPAQVGDEVAVFDPQGVLCGLFLITAAGQYGILHVYGDDITTLTIDEGAIAGDVLSFRIWSQSAATEYNGAAVRLVPGNQTGTFMASTMPPTWQSQSGFALNISVGWAHFSEPVATPFVSNLIGSLTISGSTAHIGDEIAVFDPQGVLSGHYIVSTPGQYGIVQVYGDDPATTSVDEGATAGDTLTIRVWDSYAGIERSGVALRMTSGAPVGSFTSASVPPVWQVNTGVVLDLATGSMDIDGDGMVLAATDGQLMLRYLFGVSGQDLLTGINSIGAIRTTPVQIETYLRDNKAMLDVDDNGKADALSDGIIILRYLTGGYTGTLLTDQALAVDAQRKLPADIITFLKNLM
ncbi:MAG: hypothetical protein CO186_09150 [Zetaproteobacteria bacterium CG_4_9_14_3_um_filter_49_83]|nr:MAG: hypothetical protein AUJ56_10585 [Zetaproteobacteria bacterium CG1_02_49_23]PIV31340.1 MAG: hypothetical protein COS35_01920 [Zetaproteobacteria bacterium CG02_land_8_20_14_3_00_50_9]PIY56760.1 MAG: hypothetical protein COZ00_02530 [Zetaproteobacteria bacterium CG_4_10_14_0_8_um_filter_49_80]PJA34782.1 MAG: hypothetical protein CO186_09150 [Zetaproteobacteria bacterium CG_4_9_14_3_um_filter_49_83]